MKPKDGEPSSERACAGLKPGQCGEHPLHRGRLRRGRRATDQTVGADELYASGSRVAGGRVSDGAVLAATADGGSAQKEPSIAAARPRRPSVADGDSPLDAVAAILIRALARAGAHRDPNQSRSVAAELLDDGR